MLSQLIAPQPLFHALGGNRVLRHLLDHPQKAARLGNIHAVRCKLDAHARLNALALVHGNVKHSRQVATILGEAHGANGTASGYELTFRDHHLVHDAVIL